MQGALSLRKETKKRFKMKRVLSLFLLICFCLPLSLVSCTGKGDKISVYIGAGVASFDPIKNMSKVAQTYISALFSGLYEYMTGEDGIPTLALGDADGMPSVKELENGKTELTFRLKEGLRWSNGESITPQDYVYSWNRAAGLSLYNGTGDYFAVIDGYEDFLDYEDDAELNMSYDNKARTFSVVITEDPSLFLSYVTQTVFFPISRIAERDSKNWSKNVEEFASNGAFTLKEIKNDRVVVVKNENFRDAKKVSLKEITFLFDEEEAIKQQSKGKLAFCSGKAVGSKETAKTTAVGVQYLSFNVNDHAFALFSEDDKQKIRAALGIYISEAYQTSGLIPCLEDRDNLPSTEYADRLLEEVAQSSGRYTYQSGFVYEFPFLKAISAGRDGEKQILDRISSVLAEKGIHLSVTNVSWEDFVRVQKSGEWSLFLNAWVYDTASPAELLYLFLADSPYNDALVGSKEKPQFWRDRYDSVLLAADDNSGYKAAYNVLKGMGAVLPVADLTTSYAVADWMVGVSVMQDGIVRFDRAYTK